MRILNKPMKTNHFVMDYVGNKRTEFKNYFQPLEVIEKRGRPKGHKNYRERFVLYRINDFNEWTEKKRYASLQDVPNDFDISYNQARDILLGRSKYLLKFYKIERIPKPPKEPKKKGRPPNPKPDNGVTHIMSDVSPAENII
jgi:hypothetical protein